MIFRIKNRKDGTFRCWTASGRKISGTYKRHGQEMRPYLLELRKRPLMATFSRAEK